MLLHRYELQVTHLAPNTEYRLQVYRIGYRANDAYSALIKMGLPRN